MANHSAAYALWRASVSTECDGSSGVGFVPDRCPGLNRAVVFGLPDNSKTQVYAGVMPVPLQTGSPAAPAPRRAPAAWLALLVLGFAFGNLVCTNYSADDPQVNPPIFLGLTSPQDTTVAIEAEGTGHILRVRALNQELGFSGYRLYAAATDAAVRALGSETGTDCGPLSLSPISSVEYILEAKPGQTAVTAGASGNRLCAFNTTLTSGQFVLLRALIFKSPTSVGVSHPSNSAQVP